MEKHLVIVESPAKAKTIEKFLGRDYSVMSSYGHIRDLKTKEFSVDVEHNYAPQYVVPPDKKKLVAELKAAVRNASEVLLASDEDREGEAIAWHLAETLELPTDTTHRIVFHEITKDAILNAISHPRKIDINLVNAQQARRILDRFVGFEVSPILWRKIKPSLSAGRVQSVAVRLIVEREREIQGFNAEASFKVTAIFRLEDGKTKLKAELNRRLKDQAEALKFLEDCKGATFSIDDITKKPVKQSPAPPFTTSTLQQEAARKIGFSVSQTMIVAQRLYEAGLITYMRTDSFNLSDIALNAAQNVITQTYGANYHHRRAFHTKSKGAQEAHEAIRPTDMARTSISGTAQEKRLYDLIYKRTLACQMADAQLQRTTISIGIEGRKEKFQAVGEIIQFDGFLKVYKLDNVEEEHEKDDETNENTILPPVTLHEILSREEITATERYTQRPPRYTEAALVKRMEELGIGRPSTYAPTIQTIQNREYVIKGDKPGEERKYLLMVLKKEVIDTATKKEIVGADKNKLMPTDTGIVVNDFLMEYFPDILDYNFTANVEKNFDAIADGQLLWTKALDDFYKFFHPIVEATSSVKTTYKVGEREVGVDPKSGEPVYVKIGRYGPLAQIGKANPDTPDVKPRFASLMKGQSIETITLEEALKLFDLPRTVGQFEGKDMVAGVGRFGPFIKHDNKYISIPKPLNPLYITPDEAVQLIEEKRDKDANRCIKTFAEEPGMEVLNGRFGPYLAFNNLNYRLPKTVLNPADLTLEDCRNIVNSTEGKPARRTAAAKRSQAAAAKKSGTTIKKTGTATKRKTTARKK